MLEEADPAGSAGRIRLPAEEAEVEAIDDAAERLAGPQDTVDDSGLALAVQHIDPAIQFTEHAHPPQKTLVKRLHEGTGVAQSVVDDDVAAARADIDELMVIDSVGK